MTRYMSEKEKTSRDNPLLRNKQSTIDKIIGSEGQQLAEKRLAALKKAREMPSA
jgi:hypothetical protein